MWNDRQNRLIEGVPFHGNSHLRDESTYMQWYITHTIRYVSSIDTSEDDVSLVCTNLILLFFKNRTFFLNSYINYFFKQKVRHVTR